MGAIGYLYRKILANRIRTALRKPVTYFYLVFIVIYLSAVPFSLRMAAEQFGVNSSSGMAAVMTIMGFWMIPGNLIAYAKRKGLVYRNSDVHFLFPSPVSPKQVLLYAHLRTIVLQIFLNIFVAVYGRMIFRVEGWRLAVYFLFAVVVENLLEGSIMLLLYGSEKMGERQRNIVVKAAYGLAGVLLLEAVYTYFRQGLSLQSVAGFLHSDMVQMVPLVGWYVAVLHLLFTGATVVNVAGTICYGVLLAAVLAAAWRMKCTGAFYEDAIKFAEDYEEVLASRRKGNAKIGLGKKQKYGKAHVNWRGHGARALFYRQLLEYKKSKYFIFDANTVIAVLAGIGMAYFYVHEGGLGELEAFAPFMIPAISAYIIFIFTNLGGKWAKELLSPYTYLIPDTPFRKLINATAIQNIQGLINGCLITIPAAVVMGMPPAVAVLCIIFYAILSANKMYALAVAEAVTGSTLGNVGKQLFQLLVQSFVIMMAVIGAVIGMKTGGIWLAFVLMDVFLALFTIIFMVIAALNFYKMETA